MAHRPATQKLNLNQSPASIRLAGLFHTPKKETMKTASPENFTSRFFITQPGEEEKYTEIHDLNQLATTLVRQEILNGTPMTEHDAAHYILNEIQRDRRQFYEVLQYPTSIENLNPDDHQQVRKTLTFIRKNGEEIAKHIEKRSQQQGFLANLELLFARREISERIEVATRTIINKSAGKALEIFEKVMEQSTGNHFDESIIYANTQPKWTIRKTGTKWEAKNGIHTFFSENWGALISQVNEINAH